MANDFKIRKGLIVLGSGSSTPTDIYGSQGELFSITDSLSGSLFSVNDISGIPVIEAFSNNWVNLGTFNREGLKVRGDVVIATGSFSGSLVGSASFATTASFALNAGGGTGFPFTGSARLTGSLTVTGSVTATSFTGSLLGTSSYASQALSSSYAFTSSFAITASYAVTSSVQTFFVTSSITSSISASYAETASFALNAGSSIVSTNRQTANYTLVLSDASKLIEMNSASANLLTVPSSSTVNFSTGTTIDVVQYGAGQTQITSASTGVTLRSANNWTKINARYGAVTLVKIGTNEWYLFGNLNA